MKAEKFEKFIKMMKLTTSDQDGECLNAIRKANAVLMEANLDWEAILRSKVTLSADASKSVYTGKKYMNDDEISEMLEKVLASLPPESSFRKFIVSLRDWYDEKSFLTEKQYNALKKSYERIG